MLYAYIDETGDRGLVDKPGSSPIFGMAAIITTKESGQAIQAAVKHLRDEFKIPDDVVMSSKKNVKTHSRRVYAAQVLSEIKDVKVIFVYCEKSEVSGSYVSNRDAFYNYVALKTYKNILWAARNWKGIEEGIETAFGHVKGHDTKSTSDYFDFSLQFESKVPSSMETKLHWVHAGKYLESQAADLYGCFLKNAIWPDEFGNIESKYIELIWHQIRKGNHNCPIPLGIMSMPANELAFKASWNICPHCKKDSGLRETSGG